MARRAASSQTEIGGTQSIERAIALLKELATCGAAGARVTDLAQALGLEYPTVHRMVRSLVAQRMVERDEATTRYSLGPLVYELGLSVPSRMNLREICDPVTTRIAQATEDTVFLNVRSGLDVLCIDRKEGAYPIKTLIFEVGNRRPLGVGAGGIALLMPLDDDELKAVIEANSSRLQASESLKPATVLAHVKRAQDLGYVVTQDIVVRGVSAISLPFGGANGVPSAAISVACVPARMPKSRHRELVALLKSEIATMESKLSSRPRLAGRHDALLDTTRNGRYRQPGVQH
jgi:DNA-binding IclR family transcriptional regulator